MTFQKFMTKSADFIAYMVKRNGKLIRSTSDETITKASYVFRNRKVTITENNGEIQTVTCGLIIVKS